MCNINDKQKASINSSDRVLKLSSSTGEAQIDPQGAYLLNWQSEGVDIIFPKQELLVNKSPKVRGGSHVCLPQFGNGSRRNLPPHGFGRNLYWQKIAQTANEVTLKLELTAQEQADFSPWQNLSSQLTYKLENRSLIMSLVCTNKNQQANIPTLPKMGSDQTNLESENPNNILLAPAFHPYFCLQPNETSVIYRLSDKKLQLDLEDEKLKDTKYVQDLNWLETENYKLSLQTENLPILALWKDFNGPYFCIEPTYNQDAFLTDRGYLVLKPQETITFTLKITHEI